MSGYGERPDWRQVGRRAVPGTGVRLLLTTCELEGPARWRTAPPSIPPSPSRPSSTSPTRNDETVDRRGQVVDENDAARVPVGPPTGEILRPELRGQADGQRPTSDRKGGGMTSAQPENPQPRDIALELGTPEQAADLEARSEATPSEPEASAEES